ncbi:MAG: NifB/NifX family molybdenum-iron cluster-binding protein [Candidatus Omnitrophica bacterium]|nr:NifB/NifX family molybdenum-iron cluster-binding protein [Candidatus Omnitrophota bacterium]
MGPIKLSWYHFLIPIVFLLFSPVMLLSFRPHVFPYVVAVPADEPSLLSPVSPVFSRAPYFAVYDFKHNTAIFVANRFVNTTHEAGLHVARLLVRERVGVVIAKNVGPEPFEHLMRRGVKVFGGLANNVQEALTKYNSGQLTESGGPTGFSKTFTVK